MHFMPDTEDEDSAAEAFWPEGYKTVIREDVRRVIAEQLNEKNHFHRVYRKGYTERFNTYEQFLDKVADMVAIGAENGADDAFDEIMDVFMEEDAIPEPCHYTNYSWPYPLQGGVEERLRKVIIDEYSEEKIYTFAYSVGYKNDFNEFDEYINQIATLILTGVRKGSSDTIDRIYRSFINLDRMLPVRRYPRRLKM